LDVHNLLRFDDKVYISNIKRVKPIVFKKSNNGANFRETTALNDRPEIMDRPEKYHSNQGRLSKWSCCGGPWFHPEMKERRSGEQEGGFEKSAPIALHGGAQDGETRRCFTSRKVCLKDTPCFLRTKFSSCTGYVERIGKNPWTIPAKGLQVGFDTVHARLAKGSTKFPGGVLTEKISISDQANPSPVGKQGPEFRGAMESESIPHCGLSAPFGQGQGESGSRPEMVEGDIDAAISQCSQNRGDVRPALSGKGFFT
jgi:hypothetical protein